MTCDQVRELLEEYALGALTADQSKEMESHLTECDECPALVREYVGIVSTLPEALALASSRPLPPSLKERVLNAVDETKPAQPISRPIPSRTGWLRPRTIGVALILVIAVLAVAQSVQLSVALAQERALRAEYANLVGRQELVLDVIDSPRTMRAVLRSPSGGPSYGKLYSRPDMPYIVAMIARLSVPPSGQAYHLWLTSQGQTELAGVLNVNAQGFGLLVYQADRNGPAFDSALVTLQGDGSAQPMGPPVLTWETGK